MTHSRKNFTDAISQYIATHGTPVNLYSLATRHIYTLVVGNANAKRYDLDDVQLNLVSMVEDLAASYIAQENAYPVEAIELAASDIVLEDVYPVEAVELVYNTFKTE